MIRISVFENKKTMQSDTPVFRRIIEWSPSTIFPYHDVVWVLRLLFGQSVIVQLQDYSD